jgi:integrase
MASVKKLPTGKWRARYRDAAKKEHVRHFDRERDGQKWLDEVTASIVTGTYVDPATAKMTVDAWCDTWFQGYSVNKASTVRSAANHLKRIRAAFGPMRLADVKPSHIKSWMTACKEEPLAQSYRYALHRRLSQVMSDAVHDGIITRNPCSRRTSPGGAEQRQSYATTEQVWALYEGVPPYLRRTILLGAFCGLRVAEACGLRTEDVDFLRGVVTPAVQYPAKPLKTKSSKWPIPIPRELATLLAEGATPGTWLVTQPDGSQIYPRLIGDAIRPLREEIGLPDDFRFQDLRHYLASMLIAQGAAVPAVQRRMRHALATTTLNTYTHLWPDAEETTKAMIGTALAAQPAAIQSARSPQGVRKTTGNGHR